MKFQLPKISSDLNILRNLKILKVQKSIFIVSESYFHHVGPRNKGIEVIYKK